MTAATNQRRPPRASDSGSVLVVVLMVMLGLLALGITALWLTTGSLHVGANISQRTQALYVAEAGVEHARGILNALALGNVPTSVLAGSNPCPGASERDEIPTALDASGEPNGVGAIVLDAAAGNAPLCRVNYPNVSFARVNPMSQFMGSYTVWIRNDTAEARQNNFLTDNNGAVVVRSRGIAPDNRTTVILEVTLGPNLGAPASPGMPPPAPPELCANGKNACDENGGVISGVVTQ